MDRLVALETVFIIIIIKLFILVLCIFTIVNLKKRPVTDSASCGAGSCPFAIVIVPYGLLIVL